MDDYLTSLLHEGRSFAPTPEFVAQANMGPVELAALNDRFAADVDGTWLDLAQNSLEWATAPTKALDDSNHPNCTWFADGRLNASVQCLDRHVAAGRGAKRALVWEAEDGEVRTFTYQQLSDEVGQFSNALRNLGVGQGDRVAVYMGMTPEVVVTMLACARIGALHTVVFGGFSAESLADRLMDTQAKVLVTADGSYRKREVVPLKANADKSLQREGLCVEHVVVLRRTGVDVDMQAGRDVWWHNAIDGQSTNAAPEIVEAEHPLFILYTSGSTGKPKGLVHSTGGYMMWAHLTTGWAFDLQDDDVYWCTADVGWITGHTYFVYGPMAQGATVMMYEGAPMCPEPDRFWDIVARHKVSIFYTAPTAIRAFMQRGDDWPAKHDLSSLRLLGTVGEPINPEAWIWYNAHIGKEQCPIVDTWWQTETGGMVITPLPGVHATKPGSCQAPLPGMDVDIVDDEGISVTEPDQGGRLIIRRPWPSMARTIWGDAQRYWDTYWAAFDGRYYDAGDTAMRDGNGDFRILGRSDDVLNVSGHRIGTMEVESALVAHRAVVEAAVVGRPHEIKGEALCAFVVLSPDAIAGDELVRVLRDHVAEVIGAVAKPDDIRFTEGLPKTRSGKIMRRILRAIARGEEITQDISTLEDEGTVDALRQSG
jgi:acetyl-CoA synthetase